MNNTAAQQAVEALKSANNVMVTVKSSPSVDELTAAIALTLILNGLNKHATTVFSGEVPSIIDFLQPEMAIETNTDSLRDFIIALDKSKADKLRYKVEDNVVRIFITPYKTSISEQDLEFSQGDFNVDVVVAIGVVDRNDFDEVVTAHGRILHDATIIGVTKQDALSHIGSINWQDQQASSVSEMITGITEMLGDNVLDGQIATALLTGIVSETDRFRNAKTTPRALSFSSKLMSFGANQQLIADKLEPPAPQDILPVEEKPTAEMPPHDSNPDGMLEIAHSGEESVKNIQIDDRGDLGVFGGQELPKVQDFEQTDEFPPLENAVNEDEVDQTNNKADERPYLDPLPIVEPQDSYEPLPTAEESDPHTDQHKQDGVENPDETSGDDSQIHKKKIIDPINLESNAPKPEVFQREVQKLNSGSTGKTTQPMPEIPEPDPSLRTPIQSAQLLSNQPALPSFDDQPVTPQEKQLQTLADLESSVKKATNTQANPADVQTSAPKPEEYMGSALSPPQEISTAEAKVQNPLDKVVEEITEQPPVAPTKDDVEVIESSSKTMPAPAPVISEVQNTSTAPPGPPPLMPQAPMQPQFFEADGSESTLTNPFLNPADKL